MSFRIILFIVVLFGMKAVHCEPFLLSNEEIIFSFKTENGKKMILAKDTGNAYIIYRFGTDKKIEFEFPAKDKSSFSKFKYSGWVRGGGPENAGIDLAYVFFVYKGFRYVIYDTYFAETDKSSIGIKVLNLKTKKETNIKGILKTHKGTMGVFRDNGLLKQGDELF